jgi:hypothetical protein
MIVPTELAEFVHGGVAAIAATRDEAMRPSIVRAWGPEVDGETVTLCLAAAPDSLAAANLRANGAIAVTFSLPTTYRGVQMKGGVVGEVGEPSEAQLERVRAHAEAFAEQTVQVGLTREQGRRFSRGPLVSVTFEVTELYDQTPGPGAGARL